MNYDQSSPEEILFRAIEIASPDERQRFVRSACAGQAGLEDEVQRLLTAHLDAGTFLERPATLTECFLAQQHAESAWPVDRPLSASRTDRRGPLRNRVCCRARGAGAPKSGAENHQAGQG